MRIAVLSDTTYRAALPDDPNCLGFYGSEQYHAVLANELSKRHEVHFFAPSGSTEIGIFHPLELKFGDSRIHETLKETSLDGLDYRFLLDMDFVIDMTANCHNVEELFLFHGFERFCCYRNGYAANNVPRLPVDKRNFIVPSQQNADLFAQSGFPAKQVIHYGIPEFYSPGQDDEYFKVFAEKYRLTDKNYYIFPHRPTPEKGTDIVLQLAKDFPQETFVIAGHTPVPEHILAKTELVRRAASLRLENVKFVDIPLNPRHHYYKRELYRRAKAVLAPFIYPAYKEGFGLSTMECLACGTPAIITDSPSTRELFIEAKDALICDGYKSFKMSVEFFDSYPLSADNKFSVEEYAANYEKLFNHQA